VDDVEYTYLEEVIVQLGDEVANVSRESFNATYNDCGDNCLTWTDTAPRTWVGGERTSWFWWVQRLFFRVWVVFEKREGPGACCLLVHPRSMVEG
jgi:hypothetical protein